MSISSSKVSASSTQKTPTANITKPTDALPTESLYNSGAGSVKSAWASAAGLLVAGCVMLL
jgi:hypothetical protein